MVYPFPRFRGKVSASGVKVQDVFAITLRSASGSGIVPITNGLNMSGRGGVLLGKARNNASATTFYSHVVYDTTRGPGKAIALNRDVAEQSAGIGAELVQFFSTGFSIGGDFNYSVNETGTDYVYYALCKAAKFFDFVTWTQNNASPNVAHALGIPPAMIMAKRLDATEDWVGWVNASGTGYAMSINKTAALASVGGVGSMTSTVFNSGNLRDSGNNFAPTDGAPYVALLFANDTDPTNGIIQCGTFTAVSNAATITLPWEPQWVLIKNISGTGDWMMLDQTRGWGAGNDKALFPDIPDQEYTGADYGAPSSTGFTAAALAGGTPTYLFVAIRKGPM